MKPCKPRVVLKNYVENPISTRLGNIMMVFFTEKNKNLSLSIEYSVF